MRIRYRCAVTGRLRLPFAFDIPAGEILYDFESGKHGELLFIGASVSVPNTSQWPIVRRSESPGVALHIESHSPHFEMVRDRLRAIEGMLSIFGVESIDTENTEEVWIPESEEEKRQLRMSSFRRVKQRPPIEEFPFGHFDLVARACLCAPQAAEFEVVLSFFRKGSIDVVEERYLEATYDFLFMIESYFADGKFKVAQVEQKYLSNPKLQDILNSVLQDRRTLDLMGQNSRMLASFNRDYAGRSSAEVTKYLIQLRGFLHHHTRNRTGMWHPDDHIRFGADARFLQAVAFKIAFDLIKPVLFTPEHEASYRQILEAHLAKEHNV